MRGVNLVPAHHLTARRRRMRSRRWMVAAATYAVVLIVAWMVLHVSSGGAQRAVAGQLNDMRGKIDDTRAALDHIQPRLREALATLEAGKSIGDQPNWSILMRLVANLLGDHAVLMRFTLEPMADQPDQRLAQRYTLRVRGLAQSQETVSTYVLALEQLELFDSVKLLSTQREPVKQETAVAFELACELGGGR